MHLIVNYILGFLSLFVFIFVRKKSIIEYFWSLNIFYICIQIKRINSHLVRIWRRNIFRIHIRLIFNLQIDLYLYSVQNWIFFTHCPSPTCVTHNMFFFLLYYLIRFIICKTRHKREKFLWQLFSLHFHKSSSCFSLV